VIEIGFDFHLAHLIGVALVIEEYELTDPIDACTILVTNAAPAIAELVAGKRRSRLQSVDTTSERAPSADPESLESSKVAVISRLSLKPTF
jgi:hypothetical protein